MAMPLYEDFVDPSAAIWDVLPVGVCILNDRLEALQINAAMIKMAGGPVLASVPIALADLNVELANGIQLCVRETIEQSRITENVRICIGDGDAERILLATIFPLGRDGAVVGVVLRDITDFQRFEELQRRARQVEMIQRLAGGIAHDFNNLLTGIMANSSLILDTAACGSRIEQCARDIVASSERAAELVRYMLAFSGRRVHVSEGVQLPDVLTEIEAKLRALLPERIRLFINVDQAVPSLTADRSQLTDLIEILFRNALEATESRHSGRIAIHVGTCGRSVLLEVEDDGCGIDPADVPRIFEPFFTTKFLGRGLGLAAAEGIATSCGGQIQVESAPGRGTTFRLLFPTDGKGLATR